MIERLDGIAYLDELTAQADELDTAELVRSARLAHTDWRWSPEDRPRSTPPSAPPIEPCNPSGSPARKWTPAHLPEEVDRHGTHFGRGVSSKKHAKAVYLVEFIFPNATKFSAHVTSTCQREALQKALTNCANAAIDRRIPKRFVWATKGPISIDRMDFLCE